MWNPEQHHFEVGPHVLTIEVEYMYFLTGLSRRGGPISLTGSRGGDVTTQELINCHCQPATRISGKKLPIRVVVDMTLHIVLFIMKRLDGRQGPHQESWAHILYALEAMEPMVYNWAEALLLVFKDQLKKCGKEN